MRTDYLFEKQVDLVLAALMPPNRTAVKVALHTGLRIGDVLSLRTDQLKARFWITEAKTGKRRMVGLPAELLAEIKAGAGEVWAFPGRNPDKHRTRQAVWYDVKRAARAFRMPQNVAPHSMRKLYAVRLYKKYGDLERVRRALNHKELATTMIYAMADRVLESRLDKGGPGVV